MKVNPQTDELLNAFVDGELPPRQQTEVQRMAARDPDVATRLQQLRNCRNLVNVLPRAEAPADLLEQVKMSLERRSLLGERTVLTSSRAGVRHLRMRRFLAAAAMFILVGVLGLVIYQIVVPVPSTRSGNFAVLPPADVPSSTLPVQVAAGTPFSGRLEISVASLRQATDFISTCVEDNGLIVGVIQQDPAGTGMICRISGPREGLSRLIDDLNGTGRNLKAVRLVMETDRFAEPVVVESVTFPQVSSILSQNTAQTRVQTARNIAVLNRVEREMPGREVQVATNEKLDSAISELASIPRPRLASQDKKYPHVFAPLEGETQVKASLTIVLLSAQ
jgi:hypothetical protein